MLCVLLYMLLFSSCDYMPIVSYDQDLSIDVRKNIITLHEAYRFEREEKIREKNERDAKNKQKEAEIFSVKNKINQTMTIAAEQSNEETKTETNVSVEEPITENNIVDNTNDNIESYSTESENIDVEDGTKISTPNDIIEMLGGAYEEA